MSVYKTRRKDAAAEYISAARKLRLLTMLEVKKFPTSYRWIITNNLLELATDVYTNCVKANSVYVYKDMLDHDFELRHRYLMVAAASAEALLAEITFCYELISDGNNFYKSKEDYDKAFSRWTEQGNITLSKIKGLVSSDKQRYSKYRQTGS